jgi:hypothetical protein
MSLAKFSEKISFLTKKVKIFLQMQFLVVVGYPATKISLLKGIIEAPLPPKTHVRYH